MTTDLVFSPDRPAAVASADRGGGGVAGGVAAERKARAEPSSGARQPLRQSCPNCLSGQLIGFHRAAGVPVHSMVLLDSRESALSFPVGDIDLAHCRSCGFITNVAFDPRLEQYGAGYEATQAFSATFNAFHRSLAERLVAEYGLYDKTIIEIGCGQGEFLNLLCAIGHNQGVGFDPAYIGSIPPADGARFVADFYDERHAGLSADLVVCKQTLEHIDATAEFVSMVRRSIGDRPDVRVLFQVPDVSRILDGAAFWDVFYEHCSYFDSASLDEVFRRSGFDVTSVRSEYDNQYLLIEARAGNGAGSRPPQRAIRTPEVAVDAFSQRVTQSVRAWQARLAALHESGKRVAIWGAGSKGVAFLTTLHVRDEIAYAVDINPRKHGTFLPGSGHQVLGPEAIGEIDPDVVIVMNPIYVQEILQQLAELGLRPEVMPVSAA